MTMILIFWGMVKNPSLDYAADRRNSNMTVIMVDLNTIMAVVNLLILAMPCESQLHVSRSKHYSSPVDNNSLFLSEGEVQVHVEEGVQGVHGQGIVRHHHGHEGGQDSGEGEGGGEVDDYHFIISCSFDIFCCLFLQENLNL